MAISGLGLKKKNSNFSIFNFSTMKNIIAKTLIFLFLMVIINFLYLFAIQKTDYAFKKRLESINLKNPSYDVLVIGASLAFDGIDTKYMSENGYSAYNLAIGGASLKTNYIQLLEYLSEYNHKPKYVVLAQATYMGSFDSDEIHPIVDFTMGEKKLGLSDIPMIKFKWLFFELIKKVVSKRQREASLENGQLKFQKKGYDNTTLNYSNRLSLDKYIDSPALKDIIDVCSSNNIKFFVVEMPGFKDVRHPKLIDCKILDKDKMNGIFIDYNTIEFGKLFDDDEDWIGNSHLNARGAKKLTQILIKDISTNVKDCI